jgi:hypothetical protein
MDTRSHYFRSIARCFFENRGSPFFLSPRELDIISEWEKKEIPLRVVLDGIKRTFDDTKRKRGGRKQIRSLLFCKRKVMQTFQQHKERRVGAQSPVKKKDDKAKRIQEEINNFLKRSPQRLKKIVEVYRFTERLLSEGKVDEDQFEKIESEIEDLLVTSALKDEKDLIKKEAKLEYKMVNEEEFDRVVRVKLIKHLRDKFQIPHISPYYY